MIKEVIFVLFAATGLMIVSGGVGVLLSAPRRVFWLSIMAAAQLAMGGGLVLLARTTHPQPTDITGYVAMLFATPLLIGGIGAAGMALAARMSRHAGRRPNG